MEKQHAFRVFAPSKLKGLCHVGSMDISKKRPFSHEGAGLSVSICPDSWRRITGGLTHGDEFLFSKPNLKMLDYHALTERERSIIRDWALEQGYVEQAAIYKSITWDEDGTEYYSLYDTYRMAFVEADEDPERVITVPDGLVPTKKLQESHVVCRNYVPLALVESSITALYAELVLDYDGMYWDDELCEAAYSAPRGVIFNSKVPTFTITKRTNKEENK